MAGREKDFVFAAALSTAELVDPDVLVQRAELLPTIPVVKRRVQDWVNSRKPARRRPPPEPPRQARGVDPPHLKRQF